MVKKRIIRKGVACLLSAVMVLSGITVAPGSYKTAEAATTADITTGLVAYYPFDGSLDNVVSTTGGKASRHGGAGDTWNSPAVRSETYETGKKGQAYSFTGDTTDGRGEGLELDAKVTGSDYTMSFWVCPKDYGDATTSLVFSAIDMQNFFTVNSLNGFRCTTAMGKAWDFDHRGDTFVCLDGDKDGSYALPNEWTMVTITNTNGKQVLYFNGKEKASEECTNTAVVDTLKNQAIFLGINFWDKSFSGLIDDFALYERALSADDVAALFAKTAVETADITTGLVAYYPFDGNLDNVASTTGGKASRHGGAGDTWNSPAVRSETYETGKKGQAYSFTGDTTDGRGEGLELDAKVTGSDYTMSFWVNPKDYGDATTSLVFSAIDMQNFFTVNSLNGFRCTTAMGKAWDFDHRGDTFVCLDGDKDGTDASVNEWTMVTITNTNGKQELYFNGTKKASAKSTNATVVDILKNQAIFLGINFWDASFSGLIDDFALYDRALADDEVAALYVEEISDPSTQTLDITASKDKTTLTNKIDSDGKCTVDSVQLSTSEFPTKPTWKVNDGAHATVDANGKVTLTEDAEDGEEITVTATNYYKVTGTIKLTVKVEVSEEPEPTEPPTPPEKPASVSLNKTSASMEIGDTLTLTAAVTTEDSEITWKSSDDSVATVDENGKVTAVKAGTATITATATLKDSDKKLSATCTVIVMAAVDTNLTDESQLGTGGTATAYNRVSVHDPSIVVGYYEGTYSSSTKVYGVQNAAKTRKEIYFVFGSHMAWAYSFDLKNWKTFQNNINSSFATIFAEDAKWSAHGSTTYDLSGNLWAPDIIWNPTMNKWCMYMSVNGDNWYTTVVLLTSDSLNGSWTRVGPVVYSGFTKSTDEWAKNQTDLFDIIDGSTIPERYKPTRNDNALYGMNAIDPCVLFDDDGSLWMAYGSWFGGIYMLKLDASTGLRDYTRTYETKANTSDAYQGLMIAGGDSVSGEAPYIKKINGKYYLFLSYGGLTAAGGYNMRVFSSDSITGPYKDLSGEDARYGNTIDSSKVSVLSANAGNKSRTTGSQLMNYYRWGFMNTGFVAEGHNSAFVDDDGKSYLIYHTRFDDGTEGHQVRVHQLFQAKNNGLVAAPFEYAGETLSETAYDTSKVAGTYNVILQQPTAYDKLECNTDKNITLNADGSVTGAYTGTWEQASDGPYVTIKFGNDIYQGVFLIQRMEETVNNAMCFTAVGSNDLALWGYKMEDPTIGIRETLERLNQMIPASTAVDLALPTEGVHGATISWKSNGIAMTDSGAVNPLKNDLDVVMTATITSGKYTFSKDYTIKVLGTDSVKTDTEVEIRSYYADAALDISKLSEKNYVQLANPFYNTLADLSNGAVISFDVTRKGNAEAYLSNILSLMGPAGAGRLYFTGGSYLGYNGPGGFYDANVDNTNWVAGTDLLATNQSVNIKLKFTADGFEVYKDGTLAYSQSTLVAGTTKGGFNLNGGSWSTLNNSLMNWLKNGAPYLNFGYGNWWNDQVFNGTISNVKFSYVQKAINLSSSGSSLAGIYTQDHENVTVSDIKSEWKSPSAEGQLTLGADSEHGKFFLFDYPQGSGNRSAYNLFGKKVEWPDNYQIEFDLGLQSGNIENRSESQFAITSASSFPTDSTISSSDYILSLDCPLRPTESGITTTWLINGDTSKRITIPSADKTSGGWVHVTLKGNKAGGTGTLTITSGDTPICNETVTVPAGTPTGFFVLNGRGYGLTKVDNIVVKKQGTDYANLSVYNSVLERAKSFVAIQEEEPVFTNATYNALTAAIATAESTVTSSLTSSYQAIVDGQVDALTKAIDGLALLPYTVTIGTADNGTVEGLAAGGSYSAGTSVSLTAKPASGYVFGGWKLGTDDTIVSKKATYSAKVTENITITPVFIKAADLTEFNEVLASAEKIIAEQSKSQVYTEETFSVLQQAVTTARVAVPSTLSEENQSMVELQIEALKAAIDGLKKIDSAGNSSPGAPGGTPSPSPSASPSTTPSTSPSASPSTSPSNSPSGGSSIPGSSGTSTQPGVTSSPSTTPSTKPSAKPSESPSAAPSTNPGASTEPGTSSTPGQTTEPTKKPSPSPSSGTTPKEGTVYKQGNQKYKVTSATAKKKTVTLYNVSNKSVKTYKVGATVKINGQTYKVTAIAPKAFAGCKKLKTVTVGKNVKTIGAKAFANCKNLKTVTIGKGVTTIGANCFANCKSITKVIVKSTVLKKVGKNALKGINSKAVIKVPKAKAAKYKKLLNKKGQSSSVKITK